MNSTYFSINIKANFNTEEFITLYTDASIRPILRRTQIAWRGKCSFGEIKGIKVLTYDSRIARAEMLAIFYAIEDALLHYPKLGGVFVNSDNVQCVQSFWTFRKVKIHKDIEDVRRDILNMLGSRWIRTKHVKAHTGKDDIRSYLNRSVDQMTRAR